MYRSRPRGVLFARRNCRQQIKQQHQVPKCFQVEFAELPGRDTPVTGYRASGREARSAIVSWKHLEYFATTFDTQYHLHGLTLVDIDGQLNLLPIPNLHIPLE